MRKISNREYVKERLRGHFFMEMSVENIRCFGKKQTIRLHNNGRPYNWTIILGDNGMGKTSLLKSFVSLAPSPKTIYDNSQKLRLYPGYMDWRELWSMARHNGEKPSIISAHIVAGKKISQLDKNSDLELSIRHGHKSFNDFSYSEDSFEQLQDFLCFAYGASRKMGRSTLAGEKYSSASVSLFDDEAPLINVEEFFLQADYEAKTSRSSSSVEQREKIKKLLIDILPDVSNLRIAKDKRSSARSVQLLTKFGWVRVSEMSLGYKSLIAWVVDFASRMYHYHRTKPNPFDQPAVVLIDEIDLHLHPKWQRKIINYLTKKFRNTQFIASAHSPLIVQAALEANLVLLTRKGGQVIIDNDTQVIKNWRIDQILTSDLFGLSSARSESTEKVMNARRKILMKDSGSKSDKKKLANLESQLDYIPVAETPEYIEA
ncbi:MAG: AAA family ATPase, partial [Cyclobacteriaceae bacterium]